MDMETIGGSRTRNNEAPLLLLCRCATIVILKTRILLPPNLSLSGPVTRVWDLVLIRTLPVASTRRGLGVGHLDFVTEIVTKYRLKSA